MTAKEYLKQIEMNDIKISQKQEELEEMRQWSVSISAGGDRERVQTSGTGDRVGNAAVRIVSLEGEINREIDAFYNFKHEVINQIHDLNVAKYINILHKRHIQYKNFDTIGREMDYSDSHVMRIYHDALKAFKDLHMNKSK